MSNTGTTEGAQPAPVLAPAAFRLDGWLVEPSLNRLARGGTIVHVRPQLVDILSACLAAKPGQVVSKERLLSVVWCDRFGAGAWHMAAHRPRFFAAIVPVCGHPLPATAAALKAVPVWNFHGDADRVEPVDASRVMIDALWRAGGRPRHTEYAGVGHDAFMWAYTEPALVEWLFAQRRQ